MLNNGHYSVAINGKMAGSFYNYWSSDAGSINTKRISTEDMLDEIKKLVPEAKDIQILIPFAGRIYD